MKNSNQLTSEKNAIQLEGVEKNDFLTEQRLALAVSDLAFEKFRISNHWRRLIYSNSLFLIRLFK